MCLFIRTPSQAVINDLKWLTFTERLQFHRCMSVFKCINQQMPDFTKCKFEKFSHQYNTRDEKSLILPKCKTDMGQRTFSFTGARDWNSLSCAIRLLSCQNSFRTKLIDFILESRSQHYFIHFQLFYLLLYYTSCFKGFSFYIYIIFLSYIHSCYSQGRTGKQCKLSMPPL